MMQEHQPAFTPGETIKTKVMREVREADFGLKGCCLRKVRPKAKIDDEVKSFLSQLFIRGEEQSSAKVQSLLSKLVLGCVVMLSCIRLELFCILGPIHLHMFYCYQSIIICC